MKKLMCLLVAAVLVSGCVYIQDVSSTDYGIMIHFIDGTGYIIEK